MEFESPAIVEKTEKPENSNLNNPLQKESVNMQSTELKRHDRKRDPVRTRENLIASAAKLYNDPGYFFTDSNQIARQAGFAPGTFYQHFKNKNELFLVSFQIWVDQFIILLSELAQSQNFNVSETHPIVKHFADWKGFRASMRALRATDQASREYYHNKIKEIAESLITLNAKTGRPQRVKLEIIELILNLDNFLDAHISGELTGFGYSPEQSAAILQKYIKNLVA